MPDLHDWISQQIDERESLARQASLNGADWTVDLPMSAIRANDGFAVATSSGTWAWHIAANDPAAVLRRCAADRKILARHSVDPRRADWPSEATACNGCGVYGDCDWPVTDNLNDCPELLDLAEGYGITAEELATLDRPQPPERQPAARPTTPTSAVPPALRGPNWQDRP
ncbi:DUF6221 family protein [Streptomyces virginiae]